MNARELKNKFIEFFVSQGHVEIPSASLVPENDPTTLFISAGMHPLVPYLLGTPHPLGKRLVDVQKCVRTGDIEEVGDTYHHTFFEMLGNWSLGDYFKEDAIKFSYQFLTSVLGFDPKRLSVTVFAGDQNAPKDEESSKIWQSLGITNISYLPKENNWWGPAGTTGPCGPDTEMFLDGVEVWNDVFMQYNKTADGKFELLPKPNVDTGMGVERTVAFLNGFNDDYLSSIWQPIIKKIEELSNKEYSQDPKPFRVIADHIRTAVFMIADGVEPSNKEAGYVLRRVIRRSIRQAKLLGINTNFTKIIAQAVIDNKDNYAGIYPELNDNQNKIFEILENEETKFRKTLDRGLNEINKLITRQHNVSGKEAFDLYQSFGFPVEMIQEELQKNNLSLNLEEFNQCKDEHIKQSQTLSAGKFKSGLADHSEIITKYHTTTHLLHASLRKVLGDHVQQSGSNITAERLRFDFSHDQKLTEEQLKQITDLVNDQISRKLVVTKETMPFVQAQAENALAFFGTKYPEIVSVYTIGDFSKEVCTGPHIENTQILGKFEIIKEESAGSGKRRVYAILH
ncbi:MAG TPA: alanine--tRNA ligase [Candidatus Woesebacteria bacterium]|nr:alanine--tRNA ligase [Candidatus Woesebacteria bacterium]